MATTVTVDDDNTIGTISGGQDVLDAAAALGAAPHILSREHAEQLAALAQQGDGGRVYTDGRADPITKVRGPEGAPDEYEIYAGAGCLYIQHVWRRLSTTLRFDDEADDRMRVSAVGYGCEPDLPVRLLAHMAHALGVHTVEVLFEGEDADEARACPTEEIINSVCILRRAGERLRERLSRPGSGRDAERLIDSLVLSNGFAPVSALRAVEESHTRVGLLVASPAGEQFEVIVIPRPAAGRP